MTCYKRSMLEEDANSMGSIHLSEGVSSTTTHIRYHGASWRWETRKKTLKIFMYSCIFVLLMFGMFAVISLRLFSSHPKGQIAAKDYKLPYCLTEKCIRTASYMLSSMNHKVDPCDNFYDFACGRWVLSNPIPDGRSMWGMFNQLEQANQLIIKNVLERESFSSEECEAEQKAKRYYVSCLDANETTEKLGATPMLNLLHDIGGWNVVDKDFNISEWEFQTTLEKLQNNYSLGGLFFWIVAENDKNSSEHIIQIDQPGLTLPSTESYKNITNNTKLYNAYLDYMTTVGTLLGGEPNSTRKQMQDIITFEARLASIMEPDEARRDEDKNYHRLTLAELQKNITFIRWEKYFVDAFRSTNRNITRDQPVVMYASEYLRQLNSFLKSYVSSNAKQNKRLILHNYLAWQAVRTMTGYLSKPFRESYKGLRKVLFGSEGSLENWRYCITDTNNVLGFAIGALYVREAFHGNSKPNARQMINNIRTAFKENFEKLSWMDKQTLQLAKQKADSIVDMIACLRE